MGAGNIAGGALSGAETGGKFGGPIGAGVGALFGGFAGHSAGKAQERRIKQIPFRVVNAKYSFETGLEFGQQATSNLL